MNQPGATNQPPSYPPVSPGNTPRPARGFRWIAVRPGPPPPPRRRRRPLGPTPRYLSIPRWGLIDQIAPPSTQDDGTVKKGASPTTVRAALLSTAAIFGLAAAIHVVRYILLLVNRTSLLPPLVAGAALWLGVLVSLAAVVSVILTAVVLTSWLVARRAAVFRFRGQDDPRPTWALRVGCLVPVLNLVWAPVFLVELAHAEDSHARLRGPITGWWIAWLFSTGIAVFGIATSFTTEPQGIADNTVTVILAYLVGLATVLLLWRVFDGFVRKPVERPLHRWVVIGGQQSAGAETAGPEPTGTPTPEAESSGAESSAPVEPDQREPAA